MPCGASTSRLVVQALSQLDNIATLPLLTAIFVRLVHPVAQRLESRVCGNGFKPFHGRESKRSLVFTESARANFTMFSSATFRSPRSTPPT